MNSFIEANTAIDALIHQRDKRLKSVEVDSELEISHRVDTDYTIEFPKERTFINRLSVQKNCYGVQLLIGEKYTRLGAIRYNIQAISTDDWEIVKSKLK